MVANLLVIITILALLTSVKGSLDSEVTSYKASNVALTALTKYNCVAGVTQGTSCAVSKVTGMETTINSAIDDCKAEASQKAASVQVNTFRTCANSKLGGFEKNLNDSSDQLKICLDNIGNSKYSTCYK